MKWLWLFLILILIVSCAPALLEEARAQTEDEEQNAPIDCLLLTPERPIWMRVHMYVGEQTLVDAWRENALGVFRLYDLDSDGQLSAEETRKPEALFGMTMSDPERQSLFGALGELFGRSANETDTAESIDSTKFLEKWQRNRPYFQVVNSSSGRSEDADVWRFIDEDTDGRLTLAELQHLQAALVGWDFDADECIETSDLRQFRNPFAGEESNSPAPSPAGAVLVRSEYEKINAADTILRLYGENQLVPLERLGIPPERTRHFDADQSGSLSHSEIQELLHDFQPALEITVHCPAMNSEDATTQITWNANADHAVHSMVKMNQQGPPILQIGSVRLKCVASWDNSGFEEYYTEALQALDMDSNQYLEANEVETESPVYDLESIFELADANRDGKLYLDELLEYAKFDEDLSTFQATMSVSNRGRTLFAALDTNSDDRLSVREQRAAPVLLEQWDGNRDSMLVLDELPLCIEATLFNGDSVTDSSESSVEDAEAAEPTWFSLLDRNTDGDLSRSEYPGPAELFTKLDSDGDGLLSSAETQAAN